MHYNISVLCTPITRTTDQRKKAEQTVTNYHAKTFQDPFGFGFDYSKQRVVTKEG